MGFTGGDFKKNLVIWVITPILFRSAWGPPGRHLWLMTIDWSYLTPVDQKYFMFLSDVFFNGFFSRKSMVGGWGVVNGWQVFLQLRLRQTDRWEPALLRLASDGQEGRQGWRKAMRPKHRQVFFCRWNEALDLDVPKQHLNPFDLYFPRKIPSNFLVVVVLMF